MPLFSVVFEDESLLVVNKPAGLDVVADHHHPAGSNLKEQLKKWGARDLVNAHRLDRDMSGLVVFAKNKEALDHVSGQFQGKTVRATYHALARVLPAGRANRALLTLREPEGNALPTRFEIGLGIGADAVDRGKMRAFKAKRSGAPALSRFDLEEDFGRYALLRCQPVTARRHQLRVHLAAIAAPVVNDALYADPDEPLLLSHLKRGYKGKKIERPLIRQLAMHASVLELSHPLTREPLLLRAPWPRDFDLALKYLRRFGGGRELGSRRQPVGS